MQSFAGYLVHKRIEPLVLEVSAGIAYLGLEPEQWLTEWVRANCPTLEDTAVHAFNKVVMREAWGSPDTGPYPGRGGYLSGVKNFLGSLFGGAKQGWQTAMNTPTKDAASAGIQAGRSAFQNLRGHKTEDAFANAFKYVDALVKALEQDPRVVQAVQTPAARDALTKVHGALGQMRDQLTNYGKQVDPYLRGQYGQEEPVQAQVVPQQQGPNQYNTGQAGSGSGTPNTQTTVQTMGGNQQVAAQADTGQAGGQVPGWQNTAATTADQPYTSPQSKVTVGAGFGKQNRGPVDTQTITPPSGPGRSNMQVRSPQATSQVNTNEPAQGADQADTGYGANIPGSTSKMTMGYGMPQTVGTDTGQTGRAIPGWDQGSIDTMNLPQGQNQAIAGMTNGPDMGGPVDTGAGSTPGVAADTLPQEEPQSPQAKRSNKARQRRPGMSPEQLLGRQPVTPRYKHGLQP